MRDKKFVQREVGATELMQLVAAVSRCEELVVRIKLTKAMISEIIEGGCLKLCFEVDSATGEGDATELQEEVTSKTARSASGSSPPSLNQFVKDTRFPESVSLGARGAPTAKLHQLEEDESGDGDTLEFPSFRVLLE